jgi:hypothetical protein
MRTILHGTCLLSGVHPVGSEEWKACPLRRAQARAGRARKAAEARWRAPGAPNKHPGGPGVATPCLEPGVGPSVD